MPKNLHAIYFVQDRLNYIAKMLDMNIADLQAMYEYYVWNGYQGPKILVTDFSAEHTIIVSEAEFDAQYFWTEPKNRADLRFTHVRSRT